MADLIADLKQRRLYGMAACYADGFEQGQPTMTTAAPAPAALVQAEATDRATHSIRTTGCTSLASRCMATSPASISRNRKSIAG